jgi:hypothetical protein
MAKHHLDALACGGIILDEQYTHDVSPFGRIGMFTTLNRNG